MSIITSNNAFIGNSTVTEANSPVWKAYHNDRDPYPQLSTLAKDPQADFSVLTDSTKKTIFHKCVDQNADGRLKAISIGFTEGKRKNTSITNTINKLWNGKTALYMAAESNRSYYVGTQGKIFKQLLSIGADPNIAYKSLAGSFRPIDIIPYNKRTAFNPKVLSLLLGETTTDSNSVLSGNSAVTEAHSPVWKAYHNGQDPYPQLTLLAKDPKADFSVLTDSTNKTIFHKCVFDNADSRLKAISQGFIEGNRENISITNTINKLWKGQTALYIASTSNYLRYIGTQKEIIEQLMLIGADPNIPYETLKGPLKPFAVIPPNLKMTVNPDLLTCLSHGEFNQTLVLLKEIQGNLNKDNFKNPVLNLKNNEKNNGMLLAITNWEVNKSSEEQVIEVLKALKECGDNFNHTNVHGETVLTLAIMKGYRKIIKYLILEPSVTWSYKNNGDSIAHLAAGCSAENVDILELLVNNKPSCVTDKNTIGRTPLFYVKCIEATCCLIEAGADVNHKDSMKNSPVNYLSAKNEQLSDWLRLFDPELDINIKIQIVEKYSWGQFIDKKIQELSPSFVGNLTDSLCEGVKSFAQAAKPYIVGGVVALVKYYAKHRLGIEE